MFWKVAVKHDSDTRYNYHQKHKSTVYNPQKRLDDLANYQNYHMKYNFYAKHLQKYMAGTDVNTSDPTTSQKALLTMDLGDANNTMCSSNFNIAPEGGMRNNIRNR